MQLANPNVYSLSKRFSARKFASKKKHVKLKYDTKSWILCILRRKQKFCLADDQLLRCYLTASNRGNPILWDRLQNSYYRIKTSQMKLKSVWKCRHPGCKARVHTNDTSNVIIKTTNDHIHEVVANLDTTSPDTVVTSEERNGKSIQISGGKGGLC